MQNHRSILRVHFHLQHGSASQEQYEDLLELLQSFTPWVQPLPQDYSAELDITGALRHFDKDAAALTAMIQMRVAGLHGIPTSIGAGPTRLIASMAADLTAPGRTTLIAPDEVESFLRPRPAAALPGIGPSTARTLTRYGLHTIGALADTPLLTLQRILGTATGRLLHERAHGIDPRPVAPGELAKSISARRDFPHDTLAPAAQRKALLELTEELGLRLRTTRQVAGTLSVTVQYADRSTTTRSRTLPEPTQHSRTLAATAYEIHTLLGLQRARVRALTLRAEALAPVTDASYQLTFDPVDDNARTVEAVADRLRARFGNTALVPASLAVPDRTRSPRARAAAPRPHPAPGSAAARTATALEHTGPAQLQELP
ncbi:DNA polymerase Y family protein [Streptomyces candidus]|uniref:DNA polymerase-4 n=1 Tax=Streptomyces candidus TaxID=67283 RepID=A0A7X0HMU6_9ACTN|nr:hypothetical protein [Streptomyces candidus]MBB6439043.1 DNA polymerase-4 [Streptomyces candidus]GHH55431.1 hypothetical protein GCM10018773_59810 [Streptomyces candidus]